MSKKFEKKQINSFFVCATEQSGDNIGEKLIKQLKINNTNSIFDGIGGDKMSQLLNTNYYSLKNFKSIGIIEIIGSIRKYLNIIEKLSKIILKNNYKIVITIDSPDFNYRLAKKIKERGFNGKIIHIVAPTVWAWRKGRAKKFAKIFDKLLVILPFEIEYFEKYNLSTTYIGHPIYYINHYKKNIQKKYIAFLPGSREVEILSLIKYFKIISDYLNDISSNFKIFVPTLPHLKERLIFITKNWKHKPIFEIDYNKIESLFSQTSLAIVCSGSASLEITKRKIPQLVIYKMNIFTEFILKFLVHVKYANIINIMAQDMIIPEITNSMLNNKTVLNGFKKLLNNNSNQNDEQILKSKKFINKLILNNSPAQIAAKEIEELFFPKPFKD